MTTDLIAHWHPVTHDYVLLRAPLADVVRGYVAWQESIGCPRARRELSGGLGEALGSLLPLSATSRRALFVATRSAWVACFANGIQGSDIGASHLVGRMGVTGMRVCSTPPGALYPGNQWAVWASASEGGEPPLHYRRAVSAINDGGRWRFWQSGEPYAFEDLAAYRRRSKKERFTREMLLTYTSELGVYPFNDAFFVVSPESPAVLLERSVFLRPAPEFTLEEVVAGKPWGPALDAGGAPG